MPETWHLAAAAYLRETTARTARDIINSTIGNITSTIYSRIRTQCVAAASGEPINSTALYKTPTIIRNVAVALMMLLQCSAAILVDSGTSSLPAAVLTLTTKGSLLQKEDSLSQKEASLGCMNEYDMYVRIERSYQLPAISVRCACMRACLEFLKFHAQCSRKDHKTTDNYQLPGIINTWYARVRTPV